MARGRAFRRFQMEIEKRRARYYFGGLWLWRKSVKTIGILARTPARCSGPCCGNSRKWFGDVTWQEKKARSLKED